MTPAGTYVPATRFGNLIYVSNMDAERPGQPNFEAPVRKDTLDAALLAAERCADNIAETAQSLLIAGEQIAAVAKLQCAIVTVECANEILMLAETCLQRLCAQFEIPLAAAVTAYSPISMPGRSGIEVDAILAVDRMSQ